MKNSLFVILIGLLMVFTFGTCTNKGPHATDTPTSGTVKIAVDETLSPILDSEVNTFMALYKDTKIIVKYEPEAEVFKDLLNDSVKLGFVARQLNDDEKATFKKQIIEPQTTKIAVDAIAFIINNDNPTGEMSFQRMKDILSGKIDKWKDADADNKIGDLKVVFDNAGSSTTRYIRDSINARNTTGDYNRVLPPNWFALKTNPEVVDYVSQNKNAFLALAF